MKRRIKLHCLALSAVVLIGTNLHAQSISATLSGTVQDQGQAVIPGAHVVVRNVDTSLTRDQDTNGEGSFSISDLPPGRYSITAEYPGFAVN